MKSGYKIYWTDNALYELEKTIEFFEENWTENEIRKLVFKLEETLSIISKNPFLFQVSEVKPEIRRAVILRYNTLYYRIQSGHIEILSFFSNRQNPKKSKLK
ncbi:MAG: type II toxin-antitoxin system RelE/ParE family toxin [Flavobacteriales bacterium]|nr:type II toxin-antitoxin system RelE/ParE family toxin [Flavobacteriales bacterium]